MFEHWKEWRKPHEEKMAAPPEKFPPLHPDGDEPGSLAERVPRYGQRDPAYADEGLGTCLPSVVSIGTSGCALCTLAMLFGWAGLTLDPLELNRALIRLNAYRLDRTVGCQCLMNWERSVGVFDAASLFSPRSVTPLVFASWVVREQGGGLTYYYNYQRWKYADDPKDLLRWSLDAEVPVPVETRNRNPSTGELIQHFVLAVAYDDEGLTVIDPLYPEKLSWLAWEDVWGYRLFVPVGG